MSEQGIPSINVLRPQRAQLGSGFTAQVTTELEALGATAITTREVTTAVGDALVSSYTATLGGRVSYQNQIYQQVGSSIAVITVGGTDAAQAAELTDVVLDTVDTVD